MAEYIEREAAIERLKRRRDSERFPKIKFAGLESAIFQVKHLPAADVVEVVRCGEWVQIGYDKAMDRITCSCCKEYWNINDNDTETFNYCPNCGAKMDGKGDDK